MSHPPLSSQQILDGHELARIITRLGHELIEKVSPLEKVGFIGLPTRGVPLAHRLQSTIVSATGLTLPVGQMDITFHRDDLTLRLPAPRSTEVPFDINDRTIILVDDVIFTGRSARAALDALTDLGRPERILLLTLIDRGHRRLPIQADFIGKTITTQFNDQVIVELQEIDAIDQVEIKTS